MDAYFILADGIKQEVSKILREAIEGSCSRFRYDSGSGTFVRWGLVEKAIHDAIDRNLLGDDDSPDQKPKMDMTWIRVKDRMPKIPPGRHAVSVLVAVFDRVYAEIHPGGGYEVYEAVYRDGQFMTLGWGPGKNTDWYRIVDEVTHWMPLPNPPKCK